MAQKLAGPGIVVVGGQWGDEGKGRIVDSLSADVDAVARFHGGNNAGHSLHIGEQSLVLHLIPCGIMRPDKICLIGNGVVIDPDVLLGEMDKLSTHGIRCTPERLKISRNAHVIFPFHKSIDASREALSSKIGTTKRGIGPCYEDKIARFGIMIKDLLSANVLRKKLSAIVKNRALLSSPDIVVDDLIARARAWGDKLAPFLCDVGDVVDELFRRGKRVLFEGAQGALLDIDHGTYPFVTSSNCVAAQASIGLGIGMSHLKDVLLVSKAYCTRVGEGPFFSEGTPSEQERFRALGNEFGATTGRPRRCGWLDLAALKYAVRINGATGLVLTKIDILCGMDTIKVATSYSSGKHRNLGFVDAMERWTCGETIVPEYETLGSAGPMPSSVNKIDEMPTTTRDMIALIEKTLEIPVVMISYGKHRGQEFYS